MSEKVTANATEFVINQKVLFVTDQIGEPHGSALSAVDVVRSIPENYHKFILTSHPITSVNCLYGATSVSLYPPTIRFWAKFLPRQFLRFFDSVWALGVLIWIKFFGFDIVIVNGYGSHNLWKKVFKFIDSNAVTTVISRESPRHFAFGDFNYPLSHQIAFLRSFVSHVFVSSILSDEWTSLAALDTRRVHYLPNCCEEQPLLAIDRDSQCLSSIREEYFIDENIPLILNVGTIELRKGQQDLESLAIHLMSSGLDFRIACVGYESSRDGSSFRENIQNSRLSKYFIFPGASDQTFCWYQAATMLAFTSRAEAMPRTILEAMASALPIVSTSVDGIPELIDHLQDGYLYDVNDVHDLIEGTEWILNNPVKSKILGSNARCKYLKNFSQKQHAQRMESVLKSLLTYDVS